MNLLIHIIPQSGGGGTDHIENLQLLCGHCNSVKRDRGMEYLVAKPAASAQTITGQIIIPGVVSAGPYGGEYQNQTSV
ncbi:MAG: HNH endonuclease [Rhodobacteraceae bacterium]|nr:HNH endonuclease [Paracoccaceae bacterium]